MECFGHLTHHLMGAASILSSRRCGLVLALEGGYNLTATSEALSHCVASLLSDACMRLPGGQVPTEKWVLFFLIPVNSRFFCIVLLNFLRIYTFVVGTDFVISGALCITSTISFFSFCLIRSCLTLRKVSEIHSKYWSSIFDYSKLPDLYMLSTFVIAVMTCSSL